MDVALLLRDDFVALFQQLRLLLAFLAEHLLVRCSDNRSKVQDNLQSFPSQRYQRRHYPLIAR